MSRNRPRGRACLDSRACRCDCRRRRARGDPRRAASFGMEDRYICGLGCRAGPWWVVRILRARVAFGQSPISVRGIAAACRLLRRDLAYRGHGASENGPYFAPRDEALLPALARSPSIPRFAATGAAIRQGARRVRRTAHDRALPCALLESAGPEFRRVSSGAGLHPSFTPSGTGSTRQLNWRPHSLQVAPTG